MDAKEKRKKVMARSMRLGHCVCDPRKPCPCPLFKEKNVCTCAGERIPVEKTGKPVRLTSFVRSAGCAGKIGQQDLHRVLGMLPVVKDPRLLVGTATADDAGIFRLTPSVTVVQTVDVFTPNVDEPRLFGRIAACNSLSDVYAMGGTPVTALSVIGFPLDALPHEVMADIISGGMEVLKEAGTILLGGHSINDEEVKFGFAVTGVISASAVVTNAGAKPGDMLVLTKPLGTGIISFANQINKASKESVDAAITSMTTLNRAGSEIMVRHGATACTDVTGFGLLGHLARMAVESGVTAEVWCGELPLLPGVLEYARKGMFSGANERNADYSAERTEFAGDVPDEMKAVLYDAQTSGGLLIAIPAGNVEKVMRDLQAAGVSVAAVIGKISGKSDGRIRVSAKRTGGGKQSTVKLKKETEENMSGKGESKGGCCSHESSGAASGAAAFEEFLGVAMRPGAVDAVTKELITIALGLAVNCHTCSRVHIKKALKMGIGAQELEEAAALAMAFGGCRAMVLWNEMKEELLKK